MQTTCNNSRSSSRRSVASSPSNRFFMAVDNFLALIFPFLYLQLLAGSVGHNVGQMLSNLKK